MFTLYIWSFCNHLQFSCPLRMTICGKTLEASHNMPFASWNFILVQSFYFFFFDKSFNHLGAMTVWWVLKSFHLKIENLLLSVWTTFMLNLLHISTYLINIGGKKIGNGQQNYYIKGEFLNFSAFKRPAWIFTCIFLFLF